MIVISSTGMVSAVVTNPVDIIKVFEYFVHSLQRLNLIFDEHRSDSSYKYQVCHIPAWTSRLEAIFNTVTLLGPGSIWAVARRMVQKEGIMSLMKGTSASTAREGTYSTIRLGTYELFKDM